MRTIEELKALVNYQVKHIDILYTDLQKAINKKYLTIDDKEYIKRLTKRIAEENGDLEIYKYQILLLNNGRETL